MSDGQLLDKNRKKIDGIDDKILALLLERAKIAQSIGRIKAKNGGEIYVSDREREILNRMVEKCQPPLSFEAVEDIFQSILTACRSLQKRLQIAFFGPEATFTHQAALKQFGRNVEFMAVPSIKDVFSEVDRNRADFGVVPIENSTEGVVNHTLDMFIESDLLIVAERQDRISHSLLSLSGSLKRIKDVYSHPQALAQCRKWLEIHLPGVALHNANSTADAAVHATLADTAAAIASELAGQIYHLKTVADEIEDTSNNTTRFLIVGKDAPAKTGKDKTSILFSVKDKVGALYEMLQPFRKANINLTKIESRPTRKKAWEYVFFVDFLGHQTDKHVQTALQQLQKECNTLKVLGSYPYSA